LPSQPVCAATGVVGMGLQAIRMMARIVRTLRMDRRSPRISMLLPGRTANPVRSGRPDSNSRTEIPAKRCIQAIFMSFNMLGVTAAHRGDSDGVNRRAPLDGRDTLDRDDPAAAGTRDRSSSPRADDGCWLDRRGMA